MLPRRKPHTHGRSKRNLVITAITVASASHGIRPSFGTVTFSLLRATGSRSKPARVSMMTRAIFLRTGGRCRKRTSPASARARLLRRKDRFFCLKKGKLRSPNGKLLLLFVKVVRSKMRSCIVLTNAHFRYNVRGKGVNQLLCDGGEGRAEGGGENGRRVPFCNSYVFRGLASARGSGAKVGSRRGHDRRAASFTMKIQVRAIVGASVVSNFRKPV